MTSTMKSDPSAACARGSSFGVAVSAAASRADGRNRRPAVGGRRGDRSLLRCYCGRRAGHCDAGQEFSTINVDWRILRATLTSPPIEATGRR